ncbi:DUF4837 family protein [Zeaxanthinibacter sp. PT1]|uniref:DUF4837 family protein n=1 Tax=Zeaxanthinibacter TaxID=561554 RepID=UPI00234B620A|nr:DUF4837 family protein [Zeaxanthinibacter sp. PT1]MDC6350629.1 DUF4837 family protein [Zeaxanthinibacter sp. PT1]
MKYLGTLLALLFLFTACEEKEKKKYKPESLGSINNLSVVMENQLWESAVGDSVRAIFAAPAVGLTWEEPLFNIEHMPQRVFTGTTRHRRSVLFVSIDSVSVAHFKKDVYARPQIVAVVKAPSKDQLIENLKKEAEPMIAAFKQQEIEETQSRFRRSLNKGTVLRDKFGLSLDLPLIYKVGKEEENFVWIDREIQKGTMNILAYTMPADYFDNDTTLVKDIVKMRDSIGKKFVPGPDIPGKTTYLSTEKAFAPHVYSTQVAGMDALEVRGIWEIENYPMAGPFLTYIIDDPDNNRKVVLEGFTFAPSTNKRDYMFELEAILKTLEFKTAKPETAM